MEVPMYGVSKSLAAAVLQRPMMRQPFPAPLSEAEDEDEYMEESTEGDAFSAYTTVHVEVNIGQGMAPGQEILNYAASYGATPRIGTELASYPYGQTPQTVSYPAPEPATPAKKAKKKKEKAVEKIAGDYTSLVVDCTGLALRPAMSPVIKNEQGDAIYGASNLDYDLVSTKGMAAYWRDLDVSGLARAGAKPLIVKCAALSDNNVNPVLTVADANCVLRENEQSHFLDNLNVIFVR